MKIKEIIIKDFDEIMAELKEVLAQMSEWSLLREEFFPA